jgi:hypothetical protein
MPAGFNLGGALVLPKRLASGARPASGAAQFRWPLRDFRGTAMMLSLRAVLLAVLAAGLLHIDARAEMPDEVALLPSETDAVEAMPSEIGEPAPKTRRHRELTRQTGGDGGIALDSDGATRREILNRLFAGREVEIEWRNKAFADERVQGGRLSGPPVELARRLLARANYVMSYDTSSEEPRLVRIVVLGADTPSVTRSADAPSRARQDASEAARRSAGAPSPVRQEVSDAERRRKAIEAARRAITAAQRR